MQVNMDLSNFWTCRKIAWNRGALLYAWNLKQSVWSYETYDQPIWKKANEIEALAQDFEKLSDEALRNKTIEFKEKLEKGQSVDDLLVEAFATVREASRRVTGMFPFKVQLMGGLPYMKGISLRWKQVKVKRWHQRCLFIWMLFLEKASTLWQSTNIWQVVMQRKWARFLNFLA